MTPLERVEEIIREKVYRSLHREVPHRVSQVNRLFHPMTSDAGEKVIRIDQDLVVRTESHRRLVTGRGGHTLQKIEADAGRDLDIGVEGGEPQDVTVRNGGDEVDREPRGEVPC